MRTSSSAPRTVLRDSRPRRRATAHLACHIVLRREKDHGNLRVPQNAEQREPSLPGSITSNSARSKSSSAKWSLRPARRRNRKTGVPRRR
jgi:hypothetical protein